MGTLFVWNKKRYTLTMSKPPAIHSILPWLLHCLLGLFTFRTVLLSPFEKTVGDPHSDLYPHLWGYWRWARKMETGGWTEVWSNTEPYLNYPYTGELYHVDWLNGLFVWMGTQVGFPFIFSVNVMLWLQWILLGWGVITLSKQIGMQTWGTLFVLAALDTSPFLERFVLHSAVFERANLGWLLMYLTCLMATIQTQHLRYVIGSILSFGLTVLGSWHYAMFALLSSVWIGVWGIKEKREVWTSLLPIAVGCGLVGYPIGKRARSSLETDSILEHQAHIFWDWNTPLDALNDFTWLDFIVPRIQYSFGFDVLEESIFIGWCIPLLWSVLLWTYKGCSSQERLWGGMSIYFALLALGPEITLWNDVRFYSPIYYGTASVVPYFTTLEVPWEYSWMALLTGSLCTASLLEHRLFPILQRRLSTQWSSQGKNLVHTLIVLVPLVQNRIVFPMNIATTTPPTTPPELLTSIHQHRDVQDGALFHFPLHNHQSETGQPAPHHTYLWMQTQHQRPIAYGIQQSWLHKSEFWRMLDDSMKRAQGWKDVRQRCPLQACQNDAELRKAFTSLGYKDFLLHAEFLGHEQYQRQQTLWTRIFGSPTYCDETLCYFNIEGK